MRELRRADMFGVAGTAGRSELLVRMVYRGYVTTEACGILGVFAKTANANASDKICVAGAALLR